MLGTSSMEIKRMSGNAMRLRHVLEELASEINVRDEREVIFYNGCWLSLSEDGGVYWGTDPYGRDWCCDAGQRLRGSLRNWITFWNAPRDELGNLLETTK